MPIRKEQVDNELSDPISMETLENPVVTTGEGHTCERAILAELLRTRAPHPLTRHPLTPADLETPNRALLVVLADVNAQLVDSIAEEELQEDSCVVLGARTGDSFRPATVRKDPVTGAYSPKFTVYLRERGIDPAHVQIVPNRALNDFIAKRTMLERAQQLVEGPVPMEISGAAAASSAESTAELINGLLNTDIRHFDLDTLVQTRAQLQNYLESALGHSEDSIRHAYKIGLLEAKFSNHKHAVHYFDMAYQLLMSSVTTRGQEAPWTPEELTQLLEITCAYSHTLRIIAEKEEPQKHFTQAYYMSQEVELTVRSAMGDIPPTAAQKYNLGLLVEEQYWAACALEDYEGARQQAKTTLARMTESPVHPLEQLKRAQYYLIEKRHQDVVACCQAGLASPEEQTLSVEHRVKLRYQLAISLADVPRVGEKSIDSTQLLAEFMADPGQFRDTAAKCQEALKFLTEALALDANNRGCYLLRARIHRRLGDFQMALKSAQHSLLCAPSDSPMLLEQIYAWLRMGNYEEVRTAAVTLGNSDDVNEYSKQEAKRIYKICRQAIVTQAAPVVEPMVLTPRGDDVRLLGCVETGVFIMENLDNLSDRSVQGRVSDFVNAFMSIIDTGELAAYIAAGLTGTGSSTHGLYIALSLIRQNNTMPADVLFKCVRIINYIQDQEAYMFGSLQLAFDDKTCAQALQDYVSGFHSNRRERASQSSPQTLIDGLRRMISADPEIGFEAGYDSDNILHEEHLSTVSDLVRAIEDARQRTAVERLIQERVSPQDMQKCCSTLELMQVLKPDEEKAAGIVSKFMHSMMTQSIAKAADSKKSSDQPFSYGIPKVPARSVTTPSIYDTESSFYGRRQPAPAAPRPDREQYIPPRSSGGGG